jgi:hypothetical protein
VIFLKLLKKINGIFLFIIILFLVGCNSISTDYQLPETKPKKFDFVFNYGVKGKNQINTAKGQYTLDMVSEPPITTKLKLSDEEMKSIYSYMRQINILEYPENFRPENNVFVTSFQTYSLKIIIGGKEKNVYWEDKNSAETNDAIQLRNLFDKIQKIIENKEEFKMLPKPKGAYL